jgi:hypothetical protein
MQQTYDLFAERVVDDIWSPLLLIIIIAFTFVLFQKCVRVLIEACVRR